MITITSHATKRSTAVFTVELSDETDAAMTPTAVTWSLFRQDGTVVNGLEDVTLTPATSMEIVLTGPDLGLANDADEGFRVLLIQGTYDSSAGSGLAVVEAAGFYIDDVVGVPDGF